MTTAPVPLGDREALVSHLVVAGLAGAVQTSPANTARKAARLVAGDPGVTFGLDFGGDITVDEVLDAVRSVCGRDPREGPREGSGGHGTGWIDPEATVAALERHASRLAAAAARREAVLLATGHPTGLLAHYMAVARELQAAGCALLTPMDGHAVDTVEADAGRRWEVRYLDGVACVSDGASLRHTHRDDAMRALLADLRAEGRRPGLVVADHGFAGAAVAAGLPTLSIADVNDVALPLAQVRGVTDAVLPLDDNLPPRTMVPVTAWLLSLMGY